MSLNPFWGSVIRDVGNGMPSTTVAGKVTGRRLFLFHLLGLGPVGLVATQQSIGA